MSRSSTLLGNRNAIGRHDVAQYMGMNMDRAEQIRRLYFNREYNQKQLSAMFGCTQGSISRIISGMVWMR